MAASMRLAISPVETHDGQALMSLYRWLSRDVTIARYGQVTIKAVSQQPGEMGGALDVINAVFGDAGAVAGIGSLLVAYRAWRDTRTKAPSFTIEKDGVAVTINRGSEQEIQHVLDIFLPRNGTTGHVKAPEEDAGES